MSTQPVPDPIDALIPPPRPWWVRLVIGLLISAAAATGGILWGFGHVYPRPECCGSGGGSTTMSRAEDGKAVNVTAYFFNSSGRQLRINSAIAELPGATVIGVSLDDSESHVPPFVNATPLPATTEGHGSDRLVITFVPTTCVDRPGPWGTVTLDLDVVNGWLPSIGRNFQLPGAVFDINQGSLSIFTPDEAGSDRATPLAAACELLGIKR